MKINAEQIYREASKHLVFGFRKGQIYLKRDRYWELLSEDEAVLQICAIFDQRLMAEMSDMAVREALRRIRNTPEFQVEFVDEQMEAFINVRNGVFDAENGVLVERKGRVGSSPIFLILSIGQNRGSMMHQHFKVS